MTSVDGAEGMNIIIIKQQSFLKFLINKSRIINVINHVNYDRDTSAMKSPTNRQIIFPRSIPIHLWK